MYWERIQAFLRDGDVLIAEDGTSSAGAMGLRLPPECTFITQAVWGPSATAWARCWEP